MGGFLTSVFNAITGKKEQAKTPIGGFHIRLINIMKIHYRGLIGFFVPLAALSWQGTKGNHPETVRCMWVWIVWTFLWQPVNIPITGFIPIFVLPMAGVLETTVICSQYANETTALFLLSSMINLLLNNSGADRRLQLALISSSKEPSSYNERKMLLKCSNAAFLSSIFCSRQIVAENIITYVSKPLLDMKGGAKKQTAQFDKVRYMICMATSTSAQIGSLVFPHGSLPILCMRSVFFTHGTDGQDYPDVFNYLQYVLFAFPTALIMHILTMLYFLILMGKAKMTPESLSVMRDAMKKHRDGIPKRITPHEILSVIFILGFLACCLTRWNRFMQFGWADFAIVDEFREIPYVRDAVVSALFVILLFGLPKGSSFLKYLTAKKQSQLPPRKPESGILFWRFVDKQILYGYVFLFGAANSISLACKRKSELDDTTSLQSEITQNLGKVITEQPWMLSILLVIVIGGVLANMMPGMAACVVWCPFIVNMTMHEETPNNWDKKVYLGALACGFATTSGFMWPFLHTCPNFTHTVGKMPKRKMAMFGFGAAVVSMLVIWVMFCFVAPIVWGKADEGYPLIPAPLDGGTTVETTPAP